MRLSYERTINYWKAQSLFIRFCFYKLFWKLFPSSVTVTACINPTAKTLSVLFIVQGLKLRLSLMAFLGLANIDVASLVLQRLMFQNATLYIESVINSK